MTNKKLVEKVIKIEERIAFVEETMATKSDLSNIMTILDFIAKNTVSIGQEVTVINNRTMRMENWIIKASVKNKLPYGT